MGCEMIKLCPEEGEKLQAELQAIAEHHDECVNLALPEECVAADYHHERAEWARDLADYVQSNCAVGKTDLPDIAGELKSQRERNVETVELLRQKAEFCERLERRFEGDQ